MGCERTKKERIRWLGARPEEIRTAEDRRLVQRNPELLRDRIDVSQPMWMCGAGMGTDAPTGECQVALCKEPSAYECDGCDLPICAGHANNRGTQEIVVESGFESPGWTRFAYTDTYDLCPFCLFNPSKSLPTKGKE